MIQRAMAVMHTAVQYLGLSRIHYIEWLLVRPHHRPRLIELKEREGSEGVGGIVHEEHHRTVRGEQVYRVQMLVGLEVEMVDHGFVDSNTQRIPDQPLREARIVEELLQARMKSGAGNGIDQIHGQGAHGGLFRTPGY